MRESYIASNDAFVLVYSIESAASFSEVKKLFQEVEALRPNRSEAPIILVGNKCDLVDKREVQTEDGKNLALQHNCPFREVSAKENIGINELFIEVAKDLIVARGKSLNGEGRSQGCCTVM